MSFDGNFDDQIMNGLFWWKKGSLYLSFGAISFFLAPHMILLPEWLFPFLHAHQKATNDASTGCARRWGHGPLFDAVDPPKS
jgi:hypothetical protein